MKSAKQIYQHNIYKDLQLKNVSSHTHFTTNDNMFCANAGTGRHDRLADDREHHKNVAADDIQLHIVHVANILIDTDLYGVYHNREVEVPLLLRRRLRWRLLPRQ